jgi:release factor glutamine methyltransferase
MAMSRVDVLIKEAAAVLKAAGVEEWAREAVNLAMLATGRDRAFLYAHPEYQLSQEELSQFSDSLRRRAGREPLQYIAGRAEFFGREFKAARGVLIPRPETELLVEEAIAFLAARRRSRFYEVGPGTGCISVSILCEVPSATGVAADISPAAVECTMENAKRHGVAERLMVSVGSLFDGAGDERFDLVVSNPPYIAVGEMQSLQAEVRDFEPREALTDEGDGLGVIRAIIEQAPHYLTDGGALMMEIGAGQAESVARLLAEDGWKAIRFTKDLRGIDRVVAAHRAA